MTWANLDDLFPEHPKVISAGGDAAWLYVCGLCFTNRNLTEGRIPKAVVPRLSDRKSPMKLAQRLVEVGLWHEDKDTYVIHDWDKYNEDAETVKARKEQARRAAQARWSGKPKGAPSNAPSNAGSNAGSNAQSIQSAHADSPDQQCPPTPLPSIHRSSSNHQPVGMAENEEEEEEEASKVQEALELLANRELQRRLQRTDELGRVGNRPAWLATAKARNDIEHGDELRRLAAQGMSPEAMADKIKPEPASPYPAAGEKPEPAWDIDENGFAVPRERVG